MALKRQGETMPSMHERIAYLEGKTEDQTAALGELTTDVRELRVEMRELRGEVRDVRSEMSRRFEAVDTKINWAIGMQLGTLIAILGALLRR